MDEALKKLEFQTLLDSPGGWLMNAIWLKRAADGIDHFEHPYADINTPEGDFPFMFPVFNLLMGLSFENLLKGIIAAQRGSAGASGVPDKDVTTHETKKLIGLIDQAIIRISPEDEALLVNLEKYVVWAGRYPFPKRQDELFAKMQSSGEHASMLALWNRLYQHLKSVGWIMKGSSKLWTDSTKNQKGA
jgi:hypothetical protein